MNLEKTTHRYNFHICKDMATKFKKKINQSDNSVMIHRMGRIPAPLQSLKN